jgi:uncharacterized membrane protein YfcA
MMRAMNWMPFNAVVNAVLCCGWLTGVAYALHSSKYLFAAIFAVLALMNAFLLALRVVVLRRNREIRRTNPDAKTRWT